MKPKSGKSVAEFVGILAVLTGLGFVGLEIRQNNQLARAAAYQAIGVSTAETWASIAADPVLSRLSQTYRDPEEIRSWTRDDWGRFDAIMSAWAQLGEMTLLQVEQGLLPPDGMERLGYAGASNWLDRAGMACVWRAHALATGAAFRAYVEGERENPTAACPIETPLIDLPDGGAGSEP